MKVLFEHKPPCGRTDRYRDIVLNASSIILMMDTEGRLTFLNEFGLNYFGYQWDEIEGHSVVGTIVPVVESSGRDLSELIRTICEDPDQFSLNENENVLKNGERVWIVWSNRAVRDEQGTVREIVCVGNDITAIRKAEQDKQSEVENRYRRILGAVTDYIYTVTVKDGQPVATEHGLACEAVTGYKQKEYRDDMYLWMRMIVPDDLDRVMKQVDQVLTGSNPAPIEHRIIHKNGSVRWVKNTMVPHLDDCGTLISYDGLVADITERKNIESQLYQAQKMEALGRLAGGVVHDLNNYLCVIIGQTELALMHLAAEDPLYAKLDVVRESAQKAADVSRQLLAFSRKQVAEPSVMNVNEIVQGLGKVIKRLLGEDCELTIDCSVDFCHIKADRTQIEQVLVNLVVNAKDAMPHGGTLRIETGHELIGAGPGHRALTMEPGRYVVLSVRDTGIGMSDYVKQRIFDPFFTTKDKDKGTGLGLSTVYGIIKQSNGHIHLESEEGQGSLFRIYLPASPDKPSCMSKRGGIVASPSGRSTILVIEDETFIREMTVELLQKSGYRVLSACHGIEALVVLDANGGSVDLVISDVVMPKMNGFEFARTMAVKNGNAKVLFMSGHTFDVLGDHGLQEQNVKFINKPFEPYVFLTKVRDIMNQ